jgi:hypothetical protein
MGTKEMSSAISTFSADHEFTGSAALAPSLARRPAVRRTRIEVSARQPQEIRVDFPGGYGLSITISDGEPDWLYETLSAIKEYSFYSPNWDSYGGVPPTFAAAYAALDLLGRTLPSNAAPPSVVPGGSGSLQFEWHRTTGDLEITVEANGATSIGFTDAAGNDFEIAASDVDRLTAIFAAL